LVKISKGSLVNDRNENMTDAAIEYLSEDFGKIASLRNISVNFEG